MTPLPWFVSPHAKRCAETEQTAFGANDGSGGSHGELYGFGCGTADEAGYSDGYGDFGGKRRPTPYFEQPLP